MLDEDELKGVPLLVFANKQDLPEAMKADDVSKELGLAGGEKDRPWSLQGSCATTGEGLDEGLSWCVACKNASYISSLILCVQAGKRYPK